MPEKMGGQIMNFENIKELIHLVNDSVLTNFELTLDNAIVKMSKNKNEVFTDTKEEKKTLQPIQASVPVQEAISIPVTEAKEEEQKNIDISTGYIVKSPIVGTFYASAGPSKPNFVKKGDKVKVGDVLCIVEAMKIMNEIVSDYDGEIAEILVKNEELVEFGQPLFKII